MVFKIRTSKKTQEFFEAIEASENLQPYALSKLAISLSLKSYILFPAPLFKRLHAKSPRNPCSVANAFGNPALSSATVESSPSIKLFSPFMIVSGSISNAENAQSARPVDAGSYPSGPLIKPSSLCSERIIASVSSTTSATSGFVP